MKEGILLIFRSVTNIFKHIEFRSLLASAWDSLVAQMIESACNAGDLGSIPELGRFPGEGNGNPLQYACLENSMDRGAWQAITHRVTKSQTQLS